MPRKNPQDYTPPDYSNPSASRIRGVYLKTLDISLAIEQVLQDNSRVNNKHKDLVKDMKALLKTIQPHIHKQQAKMEKAVVTECGGIYHGEN